MYTGWTAEGDTQVRYSTYTEEGEKAGEMKAAREYVKHGASETDRRERFLRGQEGL